LPTELTLGFCDVVEFGSHELRRWKAEAHGMAVTESNVREVRIEAVELPE
jgi:hypothetical protein